MVVSNCKDAKAGKEKLVGVRENITGIAFANGPVALTRGFAAKSEKLGTLGIVNPKTIAILSKQAKVNDGVIRGNNRHTRNTRQRERR